MIVNIAGLVMDLLALIGLAIFLVLTGLMFIGILDFLFRGKE